MSHQRHQPVKGKLDIVSETRDTETQTGSINKAVRHAIDKGAKDKHGKAKLEIVSETRATGIHCGSIDQAVKGKTGHKSIPKMTPQGAKKGHK